MSETTQSDRDEASGRFLSGCKPGPGRQRGSRNRLAENFVADLAAAWNEHGEAALKTCALEHPEKFCRIVADLMPRTLDLNVMVDATAFANRFAQAAELLGHDPGELHRPRKPLPNQKLLDHAG
jgi:hypothetical protein